MGLFDFFKKEKIVESALEPAMEYNALTDFEFIVEDIFTITGKGTVVVGRVTKGVVSLGARVSLKNAGVSTIVVGLEMFRNKLDYIQEGDSAGIILSGISKDQISRGEIIYM